MIGHVSGAVGVFGVGVGVAIAVAVVISLRGIEGWRGGVACGRIVCRRQCCCENRGLGRDSSPGPVIYSRRRGFRFWAVTSAGQEGLQARGRSGVPSGCVAAHGIILLGGALLRLCLSSFVVESLLSSLFVYF